MGEKTKPIIGSLLAFLYLMRQGLSYIRGKPQGTAQTFSCLTCIFLLFRVYVPLSRKQSSTANIRRRLLFYIRSGSPNECRFFPAIGLDSPFRTPGRAVPRIVTILKIVATGRYNLRQKSNRVLKFVRICGILYKEIFRYSATYHTIHPQILTRYSKVKP